MPKKRKKPGPPKGQPQAGSKNRSEGLEVARRVEQIITIRIDGAQYHDVVQFASQQTPPWDVTTRQIQTYIRRADDLILARLDKNRPRVIAFHLTARRTLYARAINGGNLETAKGVLDSEAKLRGFFQSKAEIKALKEQLAEAIALLKANQPPAQHGSPAPTQPDPSGTPDGGTSAE